jgi:phenylpyruvate tautomerase
MPLLKLETNVAIGDDKKKALLLSLSKAVAETIGKPEEYVMVTISPAAILMSGIAGDAAFVDVRSIGGLDGEVPRTLSRKICAVLEGSLTILQHRVYINFSDVQAGNWGWRGNTFG